MEVFGWDYWECDTVDGMRKLVKRNGGERYFSYEKASQEGWGRALEMMEHGETMERGSPVLSCFSYDTRFNINSKIPDVCVFTEKVPVASILDMFGLIVVYGLQKYLFARYLKDRCWYCAKRSSVADSHNLHVLHVEGTCVHDYSLLCEEYFGILVENVLVANTLDVLFEENKHMFVSSKINVPQLKSFLTNTFLTSPSFKYERFMLKEAVKQVEVIPGMYRNNFVTTGMLDTLPYVRSARYVRDEYAPDARDPPVQ